MEENEKEREQGKDIARAMLKRDEEEERLNCFQYSFSPLYISFVFQLPCSNGKSKYPDTSKIFHIPANTEMYKIAIFLFFYINIFV